VIAATVPLSDKTAASSFARHWEQYDQFEEWNRTHRWRLILVSTRHTQCAASVGGCSPTHVS